jgi:hypothetical protein
MTGRACGFSVGGKGKHRKEGAVMCDGQNLSEESRDSKSCDSDSVI